MKIPYLVFLTLFSCLILACSAQTSPLPISSVLVTIPVYGKIVEDLTDHQIKAILLVPEGADPHTYEPTPSQIQNITQAKIWFRIGESVENKLVSFLKQYPVQIINLLEQMPVHVDHSFHHAACSHADIDVHLWMDPMLLIKQVKIISQALASSFPHIAKTIEKNAAIFTQKLSTLDQQIALQLLPCKGAALIVSHPAFGYFCHRYGLKQLSIEVEGKDPLPQDISHLLQDSDTRRISLIITQPQTGDKGAKLIADKLHLPCKTIDPYAAAYTCMLQNLCKLIVEHYDN